jgi:protein gp37
MSDKSKIEWTDATWNPVRGCRKISPGCKNCYAETFAERFRGVKGHAYEQGFDPRTAPDQLRVPLQWTRARNIFVNSMSDLFLDEFDFGYVDIVAATMIYAKAIGRGHFFQVLTKRSDRMLAYLTSRTEDPEFLFNAAYAEYGEDAACAVSNSINCQLGEGLNTSWPPRNVSWGVSVEDRKYGLPRIEHLRNAPAAVRTLSIEPLLEDVGELDLTGIHHVIIGGESGPRSRPCNVAWIRSIVAQCRRLHVPVFVKQLGRRPIEDLDTFGHEWSDPTIGPGWTEPDDGFAHILLDDSKGGDWNEWPTNLRIREVPEVPSC